MPQAPSNEIPFNSTNEFYYSCPDLLENKKAGNKFLIFWLVISLILVAIAICLKTQLKEKLLQGKRGFQNIELQYSNNNLNQVKSRHSQKPKIQPKGNIYWLDSYLNGLNLANKYKRPLMIYFYTNWCKWCNKMEKETFQDQELVKVSNQFVSIKIDGDRNKEIVIKFGINGYPTIVFLDMNENIIERIIGYAPSKILLDKMKNIPNRIEKINNISRDKEIRSDLNTQEIFNSKANQEDDNNDPNYYHNLAHSYEKQGEIDKAINYFKKAIELSPNDFKHRVCLGTLLARINDEKEAIIQFEKALELNPGNGDIYHRMAHVYEKLNDFQKAISYFEKAIELEPQNESHYYCEAKALYKLGQMESNEFHSTKYFKKALNLLEKAPKYQKRESDYEQLKWSIKKAYYEKSKKIYPDH